jgi:malonyl-CoA O-methyltransferase
LDLGCGTGTDFAALAQRYPDARMIGCDFAPAMLQRARARVPWLRRVLPGLSHRTPQLVCADAEHLPLRTASIGLVWSNEMLHGFDDPLPTLREVQRVLEVGGLFMFSSLGPDTLMELRRAFAAVDAAAHVHGFIDMHDLGDMLMASGFAEPVMDMETITLTYDDLPALTRDLRHSGAANVVAGRRRGLTGRGVWQGVRAGYEALRRDGRLPATFEVVYGHAWKAQPKTTADGRAIVHFDLPQRVPSRATT